MPAEFDPTQQLLLIRMANGLDRITGSRQWGPSSLDLDKLIRKARRRTGCDDLGSDSFMEPLQVLLAAGQEPGMLTYTGRVILHVLVVNQLRVRLLTEQAVRMNPEILDQPVKRPLVVVGAPRTGTTLLNNLLALDPLSRPLLGWEALHPAPFRPGHRQTRIPRWLQVRGSVNSWLSRVMSPQLHGAHSFAYDQPDECHWLYFSSFICPAAMAFPSVKEWLFDQPEDVYLEAYQVYRRALQLLEWQRPAPAHGHWVLKSPLHFWALDAYLQAVPEASLIQTHRRLDEVLPSFCSLAGMLMSMFSDRVDAHDMGEAALSFARACITRFTTARTSIDDARILDLPYTDLVADPIGAVRMLYDRFDYAFTPEFERLLQDYLADPIHAPSTPHAYTLEQFGLDRDQVLAEFAPYHQAYGLV